MSSKGSFVDVASVVSGGGKRHKSGAQSSRGSASGVPINKGSTVGGSDIVLNVDEILAGRQDIRAVNGAAPLHVLQPQCLGVAAVVSLAVYRFPPVPFRIVFPFVI
jgi:hypothetical protein